MTDHQTAIVAAHLSTCAPETAVNWLKDRDPNNSIWLASPPVLEYILLRRNDQLIDLALAQYGLSSFVVHRVFRRGNLGVKCAALRSATLGARIFNDYGWLKPDDLDSFANGRRKELSALASNPHLNDKVYEELMRRDGPFKSISDSDYFRVLRRLAENARFDKKSERRYVDSYDGYLNAQEARIRAIPWQIAETIQPSNKAARSLWTLIRKVGPPIRVDDLDSLISRWRFGDKSKDLQSSDSFYLRTYLADAADADTTLASSYDPALRGSFFARFDPSNYPDWPDLAANEKNIEALWRLLDNPKLWRDGECREKLEYVCRRWRGENDSFDVLNAFIATEDRLRESNPEWF